MREDFAELTARVKAHLEEKFTGPKYTVGAERLHNSNVWEITPVGHPELAFLIQTYNEDTDNIGTSVYRGVGE